VLCLGAQPGYLLDRQLFNLSDQLVIHLDAGDQLAHCIPLTIQGALLGFSYALLGFLKSFLTPLLYIARRSIVLA